MIRQAILAALLGIIVMLAYFVLTNGILRLQARVNMKQLAAERQVYALLKQHVTEPGRYLVNPEMTPEYRFPLNEPVFSVLYGGVGHETAGGGELFGLACNFVALLLASILIGLSAERIKRSYPHKVLAFMLVGALLAVYCDLTKVGIARYPLADAGILALSDLLAWTFVGLAVAWIFKPLPAAITGLGRQ